jgi:hypothetical protein
MEKIRKHACIHFTFHVGLSTDKLVIRSHGSCYPSSMFLADVFSGASSRGTSCSRARRIRQGTGLIDPSREKLCTSGYPDRRGSRMLFSMRRYCHCDPLLGDFFLFTLAGNISCGSMTLENKILGPQNHELRHHGRYRALSLPTTWVQVKRRWLTVDL